MQNNNICKNTLKQLYTTINAIDLETENIHTALRAVNPDNCYIGSDSVHELVKLSCSAVLGGNKQLADDFEYLLYEVPAMDDGGSFRTQDGKTHAIRNFDDLWLYWTETGAVDVG